VLNVPVRTVPWKLETKYRRGMQKRDAYDEAGFTVFEIVAVGLVSYNRAAKLS
jgi:hypothetical protein